MLTHISPLVARVYRHQKEVTLESAVLHSLFLKKIQSNYRLVCENSDNERTSSLVQCPITHKLYRVKGNSTVNTANSNPNAPIRPVTNLTLLC